MKTLSDAVLTSLTPNTYYRARDIADQMNINPSTVSASLRELSRGGVIERIKDNNRVLYLTKQKSLF